MDNQKIGVYVCNCGTNIKKVVDCDEVAAKALEQDGVVCAKSYKYMCSNPGQEMIIKDIKEQGLDRVVVSACSPRMHEATFRGALAKAGLNPYFLEMANIREQCSWVHVDPRAATDKASDLTRGAVRRVVHHEALEKRFVDMCPATLVIGGGITGLTAALELAESGNQVYLVEQSDRLGGNLANVDLTAPYLDSARDLIRERILRATRNPNITVFMNAKVESLDGYVGNFRARIAADGETVPVEIGSVVVATGYKPFDASRVKAFGHGTNPNVITSFEFEAMLRKGRIVTGQGRPPRYVTVIHCVGSRSEEFHPYCSRVCCMTALKYGQEIKAALPDAFVYDLYIDMHAFGKGCEDFYKQASEIRTIFMMFQKNTAPQIVAAGPKDDCEMFLRVDDKLSGEEVDIPTDLIVLMVGMEAREDSGEVARLVNISRDKDGWFIESHPKLDPVATTTDGVYIAGCCQSPKDINESVAQARAATARIMAKIAKGRIEVDAVFAEVNQDDCSGCRVCNDLCPYGAIDFDPEAKRSNVISAMCKACGACVTACPSAAIKGRHFTDEQIFAQIEGVL
ncbi:MAG TPA: CoB--CoM heterodisulfide reductase iron-sulfur subunit A family protein [Holophaga sp.]|nr:CoB--CoM heterodisulfide reductase iron-sulfur subunit A family protein [Holophaga sp.]